MFIKPLVKLKAEQKERATKPVYKDLFNPIPLELNETSELRISGSIQENDPEAVPHIDMRIWVETEKYSGPTKKGFGVTPQQLDTLIDYLVAVQRALKETEEEEE